jgi:hypothetical protein
MTAHQYIDADFQFHMGTVPSSAEEFFALSADAPDALAQRHEWLTNDPRRYAALLPDGETIVSELLESMSTWKILRDAPRMLWSTHADAFSRLLLLGEQLEPDLVLLAPRPSLEADPAKVAPTIRPDDEFTVAGGCVCFPSGWRLTDKLGQSVEEVHRLVPRLNAVLGSQVDRLLSRLRPGKCVVRSNWGVCRSPELNQHPDRGLPPLQSPVQLKDAWLRVEDQCLFKLPKSGGVIFGIRVTHTSWSELRGNALAARSVARALRTMPADLLEYKRIHTVSNELAALLD